MSGFVIGPIAPESNPPITPQYYTPNRFNISAISTGQTTTVTTTVNNNYVVGQLVRLVIPSLYGAYDLNEQSGIVISVPAANQVVINIPSYNSATFLPNASSGETQPQILAIGDVNSGVVNSSGRTNTGTYIQGSFINISPV